MALPPLPPPHVIELVVNDLVDILVAQIMFGDSRPRDPPAPPTDDAINPPPI